MGNICEELQLPGDIASFVKNGAESFQPLIKKQKIHFSVLCDPESNKRINRRILLFITTYKSVCFGACILSSSTVAEIEFAALTYKNPELNRYAYQLEGFDKDWVYTSAEPFPEYIHSKYHSHLSLSI